MARLFYIYVILNKINGKMYVGKTNNCTRRFGKHIRAANGDKWERRCAIHRALRKYGINNFIFTTIQIFANEIDCFEAEKYWIKYFNSNDEKFGYNLTEGGEGASGWVPSAETKQKMREKATGRQHTPETIEKLKQRKQSLPGVMPVNLEQLRTMNIGRKHTDEARKNMSEGRKGIKFSEEHKQNMSKVRIGLFDGEKNPFYGKTHTEEVKQMSRGSNNKQSKLNEQQVLEIRKKYKSGEYSQQKLANEYQISRSQIRRIINCVGWMHLKDQDGK